MIIWYCLEKCVRNLKSNFLINFHILIRYIISPISQGAAIAQSIESSAPDRRARIRSSPGEKPPYMLMAPGVCKISCVCNVLQVPFQFIPLGVPKRGNHPLRGESKLRWHTSGSSFMMNPRPSATAHQRCSSPTLNPSIQPTNLIYWEINWLTVIHCALFW